MANTHAPPAAELRRVLTTDVGTVDALVQDERTVYVRAGLDERDVHPDARSPLDVGRGAQLSFRGHFRLDQAKGWRCAQPFAHRVDQRRDREPTPAMVKRCCEQIAAALGLELSSTDDGRELLHRAGRAKAEAAAVERVAAAHALRLVADHLDAEARELRAGGRVSYRRVSFHNRGMDERLTQIVRADGTLMDPPPEPPTVYGSTRFALTNVKTNEEID